MHFANAVISSMLALFMLSAVRNAAIATSLALPLIISSIQA